MGRFLGILDKSSCLPVGAREGPGVFVWLLERWGAFFPVLPAGKGSLIPGALSQQLMHGILKAGTAP